MLAEPTTRERVSLMPAWGYVPAAHDYGLLRLVRATIAQAAYDALKDNLEAYQARQWLLSEDCAIFCDFGGVNFTVIREWVNAGCPDWRKQGETNETA